MNYFEKEAAQRYWADSKTHLSIYPVVVTNSNNHDATRLQLWSAFGSDMRWRKIQCFDGTDYGTPLNTWKDVISYANAECERISLILEPLLFDNKFDAKEAWEALNQASSEVINFELEEDNILNSSINVDYIQMDRFEGRDSISHWLPIWAAWDYFRAEITEDYNKGLLAII